MTKRSLPNTPTLPKPPWTEAEFVPIKQAAHVLGVSTAQLYRLAKLGEIELRRSLGKTVLTRDEVARLCAAAGHWSPSDRNASAVAAVQARRERTCAAG